MFKSDQLDPNSSDLLLIMEQDFLEFSLSKAWIDESLYRINRIMILYIWLRLNYKYHQDFDETLISLQRDLGCCLFSKFRIECFILGPNYPSYQDWSKSSKFAEISKWPETAITAAFLISSE